MIRGEWWIHNGDITYCDGDYGDANHEQIVKWHALNELAEYLGSSLRETYEPTLNDLLDVLDLDPDTGVDDLYAKCEEIDQVPLWQIAVDSINIDSRAYAMRVWGWHAVRGNHVETWEITEKASDEILRGLWDILEYDCGEIDLEGHVHVSGTKGRRYVTLTGKQIEAGEWPSDPKAFEPFYAPGAPIAAVAAMDRNIEHPYYHEHP